MTGIPTAEQRARKLLERLERQANPKAAAGMSRFGIQGGQVLGIRVPVLRQIAKELGRDHDLATALWETGTHAARLLASMVGEPKRVTQAQMEEWAGDFDSWDVCDQVCGNLFDRTSYAYDKAIEWSSRPEEFVKRAAFSLIAALAVHDKKAPDSKFEAFFPIILRQSGDERNYVKKAVNWALRQIGKRSRRLNEKAIQAAEEIQELDTAAGRWIAADALRELTSEKVQQKLKG